MPSSFILNCAAPRPSGRCRGDQRETNSTTRATARIRPRCTGARPLSDHL